MSWLVTPPQSDYKPSTRASLVDRIFGTDYTKFELQQIEQFKLVKKIPTFEISGYVSWLDKQRFLLLPTKTVAATYIVCKIQEGTQYPPNNQYVLCKGKWKRELEPANKAFGFDVLNVENIESIRPDFGIIRPDISRNDFEELLLEGWSNIGETVRNLISQSLVSSPTTITRAGGLTISIFRLPVQRRLMDLLISDLKRALPIEMYSTEPKLFSIKELGIKHKMPPYGWSQIISKFNEINSTVSSKLERSYQTDHEYSISLLSPQTSPDDLNSRPIVKSDYPVVFEELIERKRHSYIPDPEVYKYLLAVQMVSPSVPLEVYKESISYAQKELKDLTELNESLSYHMANGQFLDVGLNGKPLSILNFAISRARSTTSNTIRIDDARNATDDYLENLEHVIHVWENDLLMGKISQLATLGFDERKFLKFLIDEGPSTPTEIANGLNISIEECMRLLRSLDYKKAIYMHDEERYGAVWS